MIISPKTVSKNAPKFPAIERDLSILVEESVSNQAIENVINDNGGKFLVNLRVIDVYQGAHIDENKKSLAYRLTFLNEQDTLTDEVVNKAMASIDAELKEQLGVEIR